MSYSKIPAGKDLPNDIYVAIEIPANHAPIKYEIDKDTDCLFVDRFMATPMFYPANYGFIPNTLADDGDPLDVLVVTPYPVAPGSVIRARPVGVLHMTDEAGGDAKLIAVPHDKLSVLYKDVKEYTDLPALLLEQIKHFFENYKDLEKGKWVKVEGWGNADAARAEITKPWPRSRSKRASPKRSPAAAGLFHSPSPTAKVGLATPLRSVDRRHALQPISVAVDGQQLPTALGGQAKLVAQAIDVGIQRPRGQHFLVGPEALVEIFPRQRPSQVGEQAAGQAVFAFGQADRRAGPGHGQLGIVEAEVVESLHLMLRGTRSPVATQHGGYPRLQFVGPERLADIVVGAAVQRLHDVLFGVTAGQHDRRRRRIQMLAAPAQQLQAAEVRQLPVEDQQVEGFPLELLEQVLATGETVHVQACSPCAGICCKVCSTRSSSADSSSSIATRIKAGPVQSG